MLGPPVHFIEACNILTPALCRAHVADDISAMHTVGSKNGQRNGPNFGPRFVKSIELPPDLPTEDSQRVAGIEVQVHVAPRSQGVWGSPDFDAWGRNE